MKPSLSLSALLCLVLFSSPLLAVDEVILTVTYNKAQETFVQKKNGKVGEFSQSARNIVTDIKVEGTGLIKGVVDYSDKLVENKTPGVEIKGRSDATLAKDASAKFILSREMEVIDEKGVTHSALKNSRELEFTKGEWADFEAGKDVTLRYTAKQKADEIAEREAALKKVAEQLLDAYRKQYPSVTIGPARMSPSKVQGDFFFTGTDKKMSLWFPEIKMEARADVTF